MRGDVSRGVRRAVGRESVMGEEFFSAGRGGNGFASVCQRGVGGSRS